MQNLITDVQRFLSHSADNIEWKKGQYVKLTLPYQHVFSGYTSMSG